MDGGPMGWRSFLSWRWALLLGLAVCLVLGGGLLWVTWRPEAVATGADFAPAQAAAPAPRMVVVFVSGAVASPGVYRLAAGLRIADAIAAAGGLLPDADSDRLPNLAGRLSEGKQVKVARRTGRAAAPGTSRVDLNSATVGELMTVPGMDAETAQEIIDYRERYGGFYSLGELHSGMGLDPALVAVLRRYLVIGT
ncbi:MAG: ComEA family DNA-binding protein [Candidatus Dormibacteria bacterium]